MVKGQITFDFMLSLSALSLLFVFLIAIAYSQNAAYTQQTSALVKERVCESLSKTVLDAKINGDGTEYAFYSPLFINLTQGGAKRVYIGRYGTYLCMLPQTYYSTAQWGDGEFIIKNSEGKIVIMR